MRKKIIIKDMRTNKYRVTIKIPFTYLIDTTEALAADCAVERAQYELDNGTVGEIDKGSCEFEVVPVRADSV